MPVKAAFDYRVASPTAGVHSAQTNRQLTAPRATSRTTEAVSEPLYEVREPSNNAFRNGLTIERQQGTTDFFVL